jgi:hypothetical protein
VLFSLLFLLLDQYISSLKGQSHEKSRHVVRSSKRVLSLHTTANVMIAFDCPFKSCVESSPHFLTYCKNNFKPCPSPGMNWCGMRFATVTTKHAFRPYWCSMQFATATTKRVCRPYWCSMRFATATTKHVCRPIGAVCGLPQRQLNTYFAPISSFFSSLYCPKNRHK